MREIEKQTKKVDVLTALVCDMCGRRMEPEDYIEYQEAVSINFTGGYGSVFGDGGVFELDLCQRCFKEIAGEYVRMTREVF